MSRDALIADAGEYVAGLMDPLEAEAFERRLATDPEARAAVGDWRDRFIAMDEATPRLPPSEELWSRIELTIGPAGAEPKPTLGERIVDALGAIGLWRIAAGAFAMVLVSLATLFVAGPYLSDQKPEVVAILNAPNTTEAVAVVEAFADGRVRVVNIRGLVPPEGRSLQVWTLWDRQVGPRSVGLIPASGASQSYRTSGFPRPARDQLFEITLEPAGGSPTGRPTGPIIGIGRGAQAL